MPDLDAEALTPAERSLCEAAVEGRLLDLRSHSPEDDDPEYGAAWGVERQIRAQVIYELVTGKGVGKKFVARAVRVRGASVPERLNLGGVTLVCALELLECHLSHLYLAKSRGSGVSLRGTYVSRRLSARRLNLDDNLNLEQLSCPTAIRLAGAHICGNVFGSGAELGNPHGHAMSGDGLIVDGGMDLVGSMIDGEMLLRGAHIGGSFVCSSAAIANPGGVALNADGLTVDSGLYLNHASVTGTVRLPGARITRDLTARAATLSSDDGIALVGDRMNVSADVDLSELDARGALSLTSVSIGGSLVLGDVTLAAGGDEVVLDATGAKITQKLCWKPSRQVEGIVILEDADVGELQDDWTGPRSTNGYWPPADRDRLRLDGFAYRRLSGDRADCAQRLVWIGSVESGIRTSFTTQPYVQLATAYQQAGLDADARTVAIARRRDLRRFGRIKGPRKIVDSLLDHLIGYGYKTWRALIGLVIAYAIVLACLLLRPPGVIVPTNPPMNAKQSAPPVSASRCTKDYPCFSPVGYAFETVIPLITIHQGDNWRPNASAPWGWFYVILIWCGTVSGWVLATLAVAGYTGLVRSSG